MRVNRLYLWMILILILAVLVFVSIVTRDTKYSQIPGLDAECGVTLGKTQLENLQKIQSYKFPTAAKYVHGLQLTRVEEEMLPEYPTMVTALSSSHVLEVLVLIDNFNTMVRKQYPSVDLVVFDIGLSTSEKHQVESKCNCTVRQFPFDKFPKHVRILKGYAWKPLAIQLVAIHHPFVIWMDTSVRFTTGDLDPFFSKAKAEGVMASVGFESLAVRTAGSTFQFLKEEPCAFRHKTELEATFIMVYATKFVIKNFLYPWVLCALSPDCMVPIHNPSKYLHCHGKPVYHMCHRYDQSVLSILMHRLYGSVISEHKMYHTFYEICKSGDSLTFLPQFVNKFFFRYWRDC